MTYLSAQKLHRILHLKAAVPGGNRAGIPALSAHGGIEGGLVHDDSARLPVSQSLHQLLLGGQNRDP